MKFVDTDAWNRVDDIDLSDPAFWVLPDAVREGAFALLRRERPVAFCPELVVDGRPTGPGYWSLTRHEHVRWANRETELFISGKGHHIADHPIEVLRGISGMIVMDGSEH